MTDKQSIDLPHANVTIMTSWYSLPPELKSMVLQNCIETLFKDLEDPNTGYNWQKRADGSTTYLKSRPSSGVVSAEPSG